MKAPSGSMMLGAVMSGGAIGSLLRHLVSVALDDRAMLALGIVNVTGALLLGVLFARLDPRAPGLLAAELELVDLPAIDPRRRWALGVFAVGGLGAFTTYSSFLLEVVVRLQQGDWTVALLFLVGSILAGILAFGVGVLAGTGLVRR